MVSRRLKGFDCVVWLRISVSEATYLDPDRQGGNCLPCLSLWVYIGRHYYVLAGLSEYLPGERHSLSGTRLGHSISPGGSFFNLMKEGDGSADDVVSEVF